MSAFVGWLDDVQLLEDGGFCERGLLIKICSVS
jgi:hypothetical protein